MDDVLRAKDGLRRRIKEKIMAIPAEDIAAQSALACRRMEELEEFKNAGAVLAYMAMPRECSPAALVELARMAGKDIAFPRCVQGNRLELYITGKFIRGSYGIMEPDPDSSIRIQPRDVDFIIVPGVAFDLSCNRLGHGAGYYDRLLTESGAATAGLALEEQVVEAVPVGRYDVPLDYVVWRNGIYCK